jgi:hypothetical protein
MMILSSRKTNSLSTPLILFGTWEMQNYYLQLGLAIILTTSFFSIQKTESTGPNGCRFKSVSENKKKRAHSESNMQRAHSEGNMQRET